MKRNHRIIIVHSLIPVLIGGLIYLLFRPPGLLMFEWSSLIGLNDVLYSVRKFTYPAGKELACSWIIFSIPNALWIYSLTSFMIVYWYDHNSPIKYFWFAIGPFIGISAEIGQLIKILPGTYDSADLITALIASAIAFYLVSSIKEKVRNNEQKL